MAGMLLKFVMLISAKTYTSNCTVVTRSVCKISYELHKQASTYTKFPLKMYNIKAKLSHYGPLGSQEIEAPRISIQ
jgi:hypothetical protein